MPRKNNVLLQRVNADTLTPTAQNRAKRFEAGVPTVHLGVLPPSGTEGAHTTAGEIEAAVPRKLS
eukprot:269730-Heterocapsa_arctica.AAC.1